MIDQIISLSSSQFSKLPKTQVFRTWDSGEENYSSVFVLLCCVVHLLISEGIV